MQRIPRWVLGLGIAVSVAPRPSVAQKMTGAVVDKLTSIPVVGVKVELLIPGSDRIVQSAYSDHVGRFTFALPGTGLYRLTYTRSGYLPALDWRVFTINSLRDTLLASARIEPDSVLAVAVRSASAKAMAASYYETRRILGHGTFITQIDIAAAHYADVAAAVAAIPGARVDGNPAKHKWKVTLAPENPETKGCRPAFFINGGRLNGLNGEFTDEMLPLILETPIQSVWAIEAYGAVTTIPGVYAGPELSCGALNLLTRPPA